MPEFNWRMGVRTLNSVRVMVHSDTGGVLTAVVNGTTYTGDTLVAEYPGKVDIKNVSGAFTASLLLDGVVVDSAELSVLGVGDYVIAWGSCAGSPDVTAADAIVKRYGADFFIAQGDMPYINDAQSYNGIVAVDPAADQSEANTLNHHKVFMQGQSMQTLGRKTSYIFQPDDHEYFGDNFDNTAYQMFGENSFERIGPAVAGGAWSNPPFDSSDSDHTPPADANSATLGNMNMLKDICNNAIRAYRSTNPDPLASDIFYSTTTVSDVAMIFMLDCINQKDATARRTGGATDKDGRNHASHSVTIGNATMLGTTQKAQFKSDLLKSQQAGIPFKIISSTKRTLRTATSGGTETGNGDSWDNRGVTFEGYEYELEEILQFIDDNGITGVIWISGDKHYPHVQQMESGGSYTVGSGSSFDHCCVVACPISLPCNGLGAVIQDGLLWGPHTHDGTDFNQLAYSNFGLLEIHGHEYIQASICNTAGRKMGSWKLHAGENKFRSAGPASPSAVGDIL